MNKRTDLVVLRVLWWVEMMMNLAGVNKVPALFCLKGLV